MIRTRKRWIEMAMVVLMLSTLLYPLAGNDTVARAASTSPEDYNISIKCDVTEVKVGDIVNVTIYNEGEELAWVYSELQYNEEILELANYTDNTKGRGVSLSDYENTDGQREIDFHIFCGTGSWIKKGEEIVIISFKVKKAFVTEAIRFTYTYFGNGTIADCELTEEHSCDLKYNENANNTNTIPPTSTPNPTFVPEEVVEYEYRDYKIALLIDKKKVKKGETITVVLQNKGKALYDAEMTVEYDRSIINVRDTNALFNGWTSNIDEEDGYWIVHRDGGDRAAESGEIMAQLCLNVDKDFSTMEIAFKDFSGVLATKIVGIYSPEDESITLTINGYADENPTPAPTTLTTATPATTVSPLPTATPTTTTHLFTDSNYTESAKETTVSAFANGSTVKTASGKKNYKSTTLYTDITASQYQVTDKKGKTKTSQGKVIVGITETNTKPTLSKGKIVDKAAAKMATAKIKNGVITITAGKESGCVYLWVMDTGDTGTCDSCLVYIYPAPTNISTYAISDKNTDFAPGTTPQYKKAEIALQDSVRVYIYPTYKKDGVKTKTTSGTYTATVAGNAKEYFSVQQDSTLENCFVITAKALKSDKKFSGKITIQCNENGKKATFTATAVNPVRKIGFEEQSGEISVTSLGAITVKASDTEKKTYTTHVEYTGADTGSVTTDTPKLYAMAAKDGFDTAQLEKGKVKITRKLSQSQKKLTAKIGKDKKTLTITIAKKAEQGTTVYYLLVYNTKKESGKCGYQVFSVSCSR